MTSYMYDCIGGNAARVHRELAPPKLMAWYGTGSGINWTTEEKNLFPASSLVEIDQGGAGTPVFTAVVRDVENGAWAPGQAVNRDHWNVARPTIYTTRYTLGSILADGWKGDLWLAWPGWNGEPLPDAPGCHYVAVQDQWNDWYDRSTLLDSTWPHLPLPLPGRVTGVSITPYKGFADFGWAPRGKDEYQWRIIPATGVDALSGFTYDNHLEHKVLPAGSYRFMVRAGNHAGWGPWSEAKGFQVQ